MHDYVQNGCTEQSVHVGSSCIAHASLKLVRFGLCRKHGKFPTRHRLPGLPQAAACTTQMADRSSEHFHGFCWPRLQGCHGQSLLLSDSTHSWEALKWSMSKCAPLTIHTLPFERLRRFIWKSPFVSGFCRILHMRYVTPQKTVPAKNLIIRVGHPSLLCACCMATSLGKRKWTELFYHWNIYIYIIPNNNGIVLKWMQVLTLHKRGQFRQHFLHKLHHNLHCISDGYHWWQKPRWPCAVSDIAHLLPHATRWTC